MTEWRTHLGESTQHLREIRPTMPLDATPGSRRMSVAIDELLTVSLRGGPPTLPTDATPRSRRVSVAVDDMLTGCLQEILPQEQRRIHIVGSVAIEDALPTASRRKPPGR